MTNEKNFKHLVRDEARRTGRRYTEVRADLRGGGGAPGGGGLTPTEVAERFEAIVAAIDGAVFGVHDLARLVALGLITPGNLLLAGGPGNGMTALGEAVSGAVGGRHVMIDGRTGLGPADPQAWEAEDVVVINHFDGLDTAAQVQVVEAGRSPAILIIKCNPVPDRMPFPPDDDTRERFLFGGQLKVPDGDTLLKIIAMERDGLVPQASSAAIGVGDLPAMRAAAASVVVPHEVRRFAIDAVARTREDGSVVIPASTVASLDLVRASAAAAIAAGRDRATPEDVESVLGPVLAHRLVMRDGVDAADVIARVATPA